jgi:integrase
MACRYKRKNSPYWWIKPANGKPYSTKLRHDVANETQKAQDLLETAIQKERQQFSEPERWELWAPQYIDERYEDSPKSHWRYKLRWKSIRSFLSRHKINYPRQLTFNQISLYVAWRRKGDADYGVWPASKNTAIGDVKFLGLLMHRAIQLGFAEVNSCRGLGLKKTKAKEKNEITDEHFKVIWDALQTQPQWMQDSFAISFNTGCRMHECAIPLDCADTKRQFIHFPIAKGDKPFTVPMRPELVPLFERLKKERPGGKAVNFPEGPTRAWWYFFTERVKLPYSFHCLRVTFISRLARAGVPAMDAMRLVNHASYEIHRIYQRFQPEDLRASLQKLSLPALQTHDERESRDAR